MNTSPAFRSLFNPLANAHNMFLLFLILTIITSLPSPSSSSAIPRSLTRDAEVLSSNNKYDYDEALRMSLLFYEAQRSGKLPDDNRISWRGDSLLDDKGENGEDLTGGYYDAGSDYVKVVWTQASTSTMIAWGLHTASKGYRHAGALKDGLDCLKWASDFILKCHISPNELYGQIGDFSSQKIWGRPEDLNITRPAYKITPEKPGSDLAGEAAAALAATSLVFKEHGDTQYAELCLMHAKQLYQFARNYRGLHHLSMKTAAQYYESSDYGDELAWAAAWLYKASNNTFFLDEAENHYNTFRLKERPNEFSRGHRVAGVQVLLADLTGRAEMAAAVKAFCDHQLNDQQRSPQGLLLIEREGALSHAANVAFICLQAAKLGINSEKYQELAKQQINYILGDTGHSFVVGFGISPPRQPFHAASSCPLLPTPCGWDQYNSKDANPHVLYGALVSGPNENDVFVDQREEFIYTEVTVDYNAGFQSTLAELIQLSLGNDTTFIEPDYRKPSYFNTIFHDGKTVRENVKSINVTESKS